ncbi:dermonecrotic toxin domain-containing protein [Pseudomonas neuropathica]|uniref:dermonecrotic toxin domain-containing protein n=1 Tax=Pseudomonas neuropathica TaxID=2730425 RepID=UPI003EB99AA8
MPEIPSPSAVDVVTQLVTGPSLREVASKTLRPALRTLYPEIDLDPQLAMVVRPTWVIEDDQVVPGRHLIESLTDTLVRLGLSGTTVAYLDGEHYLTLQPDLPSAIQLPVKISAIGKLLNELAPLLFIAYKEHQVNYWDDFTYPGQPRWQQMSQALHNLWKVDANTGWDADQRAMVEAVYKHPDKNQRLPTDKYQTRACLIDLDRGEGDDQNHVTLLDTAVLIGTDGERSLIMTHSVIQGFENFESLEKLGEALPNRYWKGASGAGLKWRLVEPQGNFFDYQACTLIALEAEALGAINFFQGANSSELYPHTGTIGNPGEPTPRLKPHIDRLRPMLPAWLDGAVPADQTRYSRHLLDLTMVQHTNKGKSFQNEVISLQAFTRDALKKQLLKDHPLAAEVKIDDIEISITSLVVWGTFVLPGNTQTQTLSLMDLALQNLAGQPIGNKTVRYKDGSVLPEWMTASYLEQLVSSVDIGKTYPAHLQNLLVDDSEQAAALQALYTSQLPIELPLLALQHKIQGKAGITEQGYRYVVAALANTGDERHVDRDEIVIRPLAFMAHRSRSQADTVNNMFVIGPREVDKGPCVLYRPLFEMALMQFPSHTNLLYEIQHSQHLRESVLAWLPDDVRFSYSQFVFTARLPSVWTIPQLLVNPFTALDMSGPVTLATATIEDHVLATLHDSNVQAVITQADRQSVSDAEARWATLKHGGWMMFNAALPFLGRSVGTAAWIWQIMDDLQEISDVANEQSGKIAWTALADILLALGMVLAHRAAVGDQPISESIPQEEPTPTVAPDIVASKPVQLPDISSTALPITHEMAVNPFTALKRSPVALAALLDSFQIAKPRGIGDAASEGTHHHLYPRQKQWFAPVGKRWFEVIINEHAKVQIIDSHQQPPRNGPLLTRTVNGQWVIDLRLRLRGGGLDSALQVVQDINKMDAVQLIAEISAFDATMEAKRIQCDADHAALKDAPPSARAQARQQYLATLESQYKAYSTSVEQIKALHKEQPIPNYREAMTQRLEVLLFLGQGWLELHATEFQANLDIMQAMLADEANFAQRSFVRIFEEMTDQTQAIIEKIELAETRFDELKLLGKKAVEVVRTYRKALPEYDLNDLKLLQISLGQEICIKAGETATAANAYEALASLIEDAALSIQSTLNLTADESLDNLRERTDVLSNVAEQFSTIDQRLGDLLIDYPEQIYTERLENVRKRVIGFKARTDTKLAELLRYKHLLEPTPGPSRPRSSTRQIIKTKSKGTVVGVRKKRIKGQNSDVVEVRNPLKGIIATFEEESPGVWVEQRTVKPKPPKASATLNTSIRAGQALIDGLTAFHRRIEAQLKRGRRLPVEAEEYYHKHAAALRKANAAIDEALTASNLTADLKKPTEELGHKLDEAANSLDEKGTSTRVRMVKQQPPTAAGIQWLKEQGEVTISQTVTRRRLKGPDLDFLDEYEIRDAHTNKVVCYAHFHYSSVQAPVTPFPAGHMKTVAQRRMGGAYEPRFLSNQALIEIHRSGISDKSARALFLTPATPVATDSAPL